MELWNWIYSQQTESNINWILSSKQRDIRQNTTDTKHLRYLNLNLMRLHILQKRLIYFCLEFCFMRCIIKFILLKAELVLKRLSISLTILLRLSIAKLIKIKLKSLFECWTKSRKIDLQLLVSCRTSKLDLFKRNRLIGKMNQMNLSSNSILILLILMHRVMNLALITLTRLLRKINDFNHEQFLEWKLLSHLKSGK